MDVKCPSSGEMSDLFLLKGIRDVDSVKFVVKDLDDCRYAQSVIERHSIAGKIFISPVYGTNYAPIVNFILASGLKVRFQIQLHKVLGIQ